MSLDLDFVRSQFPGLRDDDVLFDNAGGSLPLGRVAERISEHMLHFGVQLGASYARSAEAAARYSESRRVMAAFAGASRPEEIVFGPSSTILLRILAEGARAVVHAGDEVVVTRVDHEANIGCWERLCETQGATIRFWEPNPTSGDLELEGLLPLLCGRTKLVAMTHVSNIFGTIHPIEEIVAAVHEHGARICVDGVAYAPHRPLRVADWGADYYVFSLYKVFGPHHAVLYCKHESFLDLEVVNHEFFQRQDVPGKFEPGNANYELSWGATGIADYFVELGRHLSPGVDDATARGRAWDAVAEHEEQLAEGVLAFLRGRDDVTIVGREASDRRERVPTISFVHATQKSSEIVAAVDRQRIGIRFGHFYAARLIESLGHSARDGVVRVSMVHYNTLEEVDRLVSALRSVLDGT